MCCNQVRGDGGFDVAVCPGCFLWWYNNLYVIVRFEKKSGKQRGVAIIKRRIMYIMYSLVCCWWGRLVCDMVYFVGVCHAVMRVNMFMCVCNCLCRLYALVVLYGAKRVGWLL